MAPARTEGVTIEDGIVRGEDGVARCAWGDSAPEYRSYHDTEWGFPVSDDVRLFEKLSLEGFQGTATSLVCWLNGDRPYRGKIDAVINNARRAGELAHAEGSLAAYVWRFEPEPGAGRANLAGGAPPAQTAESAALARDLKRRGWRFVGPTTAYAFMQAMGLVNDHQPGCAARAQVDRARASFDRP